MERQNLTSFYRSCIENRLNLVRQKWEILQYSRFTRVGAVETERSGKI